MHPKHVRTFGFLMTLIASFSFTAFAQVAGQNVNMVSGTDWTTGDPFLQRQNEPSIAVSTRNPGHLLAAANDYRSVDLPGVLGSDVTGDAWLGIFKSFDGGQTWQSALLPGYPLDGSPQGTASPIHGFQAAADPTLRSGTNGLFYLNGIAFNRGTNAQGAIFVTRFIDNNNRENGDPTAKQGDVTNVSPRDSMRYVSTSVVDTGNSGQFLDKPWIAVDVPRGSATCTVPVTNANGTPGTQTVPAGAVLLTYSKFTGATSTKITFTRSADCGVTWSNPIKLSESNSINQGTVIAIDPSTESALAATVYVAWRRFATSSAPDAMMIAKSTDGGQTFTKGVEAVTFPVGCSTNPTATGCPMDQGLSPANPFGGSFRTNSYPALAVDGAGHVYLAWSQRKANGDARITMTVSADGLTWTTPPVVIDDGNVSDDDGNAFFNLSGRGHQVMPALSFNAGKLTLVYYDLRQDHTMGLFSPSPATDPTHFSETRQLVGELVSDPLNSAVFNPYITDGSLTGFPALSVRRHTIDVQGAQATPPRNLAVPSFKSFRISRYLFGINTDVNQAEQLQVNVPNLPLFMTGSQPFIGDYIDVAGAQPFVFSGGKWHFNTAAVASPVFHATWTDNRDVRAPLNGDWTKYTPPFSSSNPPGTHPSITDPSQTVVQCNSDSNAGMRNQNIYTARIAPGLVVTSPANSKLLGTLPSNASLLFQRAFAVIVQNTTDTQKVFRITVLNQPPDAPTGQASVLQFSLSTTLDVTVAAHSSVSRPVFVKSANTRASINVQVAEIAAVGAPGLLAGGLQSTITLNPDPTAPAIIDPENPAIGNPAIGNFEVYNPAIGNPAIGNPAIGNPAIGNPAIGNPAIGNPAIGNPNFVAALQNPAIGNPAIGNPAIGNPAIGNPAIGNQSVTDATYTVKNVGNTSSSYAVKLFGTQPTATNLQLLITKVYATPIQENCQLTFQYQTVVVANVLNPVFATQANVGDPILQESSVANATVALAPNETAFVTLRATVDSQSAMQNLVLSNVTPVVVAHAANTQDAINGVATPPATLVVTAAGSLANAFTNKTYSAALTSFGGIGAKTWSVISGTLPAGLQLDSSTGVISGTPTVTGTSTFTVQVTDSAPQPNTATRSVTLTVVDSLVVSIGSLPDAVVGQAYSQTLTTTGGVAPFTWTVTSGALPAGLTLSSSGVISGTPTANGTSTFTLQVADSGNPAQTATASFTLRVTTALAITTATLPNPVFGTAYNQTLAASGGTAPLTWDIVPGSGTLPPGLSLAPSGTISGTPTATGSFTFTVRVTDSATPQQTATRTFTLTVPSLFTIIFSVQPSDTSPNAQITPAVKVTVLDSKGKAVSGAIVKITLAVNPGGATLSGTTVQTTGNTGVAIFASQTLDKVGTGYRLQAEVTNFAGAAPVLSNPFNVR